MASRYIARKYGDQTGTRSRASSVVSDSYSRASSLVNIFDDVGFILIFYKRFEKHSHLMPEEYLWPHPHVVLHQYPTHMRDHGLPPQTTTHHTKHLMNLTKTSTAQEHPMTEIQCSLTL